MRSSNRVKLALAAFFAISCSGSSSAQPQGDIQIDVGRGLVTVHVPPTYNSSTPLLLLLHGYSWNAGIVESYMQLEALADQEGYLYCVPEGTVDTLGNRFWNASDACCNLDGSTVDDSGYLRDLIEEIQAQLGVDPLRIFIVGQSNGGFMAYRMACDHSDLIAGVVSFGGAPPLVPCVTPRPVNVLEIHGDADPVISYTGGSFMGLPNYPGAIDGVEGWAINSGCSLVPEFPTEMYDLVSNIPGPDTDIRRYNMTCTVGLAELWTIQGAGHIPPLTQEFRERIFDWLRVHPKRGVNVVRLCQAAAPNSTGSVGRIEASGSDLVANGDFMLVAHALPDVGFALFIMGTGAGQHPLGNGFLCVTSTITRMALAPIVLGRSELLVDFGAPQIAGLIDPSETWYFQAWHRDNVPVLSSNLTDAIEITFH